MSSIQVKIALTYIAVIVAMLALLNTYPVIVTQSFVFQSKQESMQTRASMLASSLSGLESLTQDGVARIMAMLDDKSSVRIIVADTLMTSLFDNSVTDNTVGKAILFPEFYYALDGSDVFHGTFKETAFECRAAAPVLLGGQVIGAVCVYEYDTQQATLLRGIQANIASISLIISAAVIIISMFLSSLVTRRISALLGAIRAARRGNYEHRARVSGRDELAELALEFNELASRLSEVETMRRRFVSDASHELKTPLASVRLLVDSILQNRDVSMEIVRDFLSDIGDEVDRLTRLTEKLLDLTKLDALVAAKLTEINMTEVIKKASRMLEPLAAHYGVTQDLRLEERCFLLINEDGIYQIVVNLIENAIKYNNPGGRVMIALHTRGRKIVFEVADTGVGIPEDDLPRVFERFYRVDKARSREAGGSGLGLSIVSATVRQYGGTVRVESTPGIGTRFYVEFPIKKGVEAERHMR